MSAAPAGPPPLLNIANVLTGLRLVLVPVFLALLMHGDGTETGWRLGAFAVFAVAAVTDRFDGELARSRGLVTAFGTIADPIADKALIGSALIGLSLLGQLPWWVTVVIMGREVGITLLRFFVLRHGIIPASRGGKAKTLVQTVAIGLFVLPLETLPELAGPAGALRWVILAVALVLTVVTGFDYVLRAMRLRSTAAATVRDPG
jgi:CDP-diacylglycerol---glycerol-3-phosphate 3-phosphatidyltransferase